MQIWCVLLLGLSLILPTNQILKKKVFSFRSHPLGERIAPEGTSSSSLLSKLTMKNLGLRLKNEVDWTEFHAFKDTDRCIIPGKAPKRSTHYTKQNCIVAASDAILLAKEFAKITVKAALMGKPIQLGVNKCMSNLASSATLSLTGHCYSKALNEYFTIFTQKLTSKMLAKGWKWDNEQALFYK